MRPIFNRPTGDLRLGVTGASNGLGKENKAQSDPGVQAPAPKSSLPKRPAGRWSWMGMGPNMFGRVGVGIAVTAALLGTLVGDTPAAKVPREPTQVVSVVPGTSASDHAAHAFSVLRQARDLVVPATFDRQAALMAMRTATVSVVLEQAQFIAKPGSTTEGLSIPAGTRFTAFFSPSGITLSASPSLTYRADWAPDAEISQLTFSFATGQFTAQASGLGPDEWYQEMVVNAANTGLRSRLPEAMLQPGYNPLTDPAIEANVQRLIDTFTETTCTPSRPTGTSFGGLTGLELGFTFAMPADFDAAIPASNHHAWIKAGTRVEARLSTAGAITDPELSRLSIHFSQPVVIGEGSEAPGTLNRMELKDITLGPNAQLSLNYELGLEQTIDGGRALLTILAIAADPRSAGSIGSFESTRLAPFRGEIQGGIDQRVEPHLAGVIRANDQAINGLSLARFFGLR